MKLRPLIKKSVRAFYDGQLPMEAINASEKPYVYTMEFFDMLLEKDLDEVEVDAEQE